MKKIKSITIKTLFLTMILTMLYTSTTMAATTGVGTATSIDQSSESIENNLIVDDDRTIIPYFNYWNWVRNILLVFVGVAVANAFITNAVNNGVTAACDKWSGNWGVRQACKVIAP